MIEEEEMREQERKDELRYQKEQRRYEQAEVRDAPQQKRIPHHHHALSEPRGIC